jgi:large subunit ribosomal protein L47
MARIKYVLNERRLALIATAEFTRPSESRRKVHGKSPLGRSDPMSLTGWEKDVSVPISFDLSRPASKELDTGDGERQKLDTYEPADPVIDGDSVSKQEIEGRDEGFGSGKEAEEFVKNTNIKV